MRISVSLNRKLVERARRAAAERETTVAGLVRDYLEGLAAETEWSTHEDLERLERSFEKFQFSMGKRTWKREDLYERGLRRED